MAVRTTGGFNVLREPDASNDQPRHRGALRGAFVLLFVVARARQSDVRSSTAPAIAARPNNPRHALLDACRGRILATDGTVLARTRDGTTRRIRSGDALAQTVGYVSPRYGTSGHRGRVRPRAHAARYDGRSAGAIDEIRAALTGASQSRTAPTSSRRSNRRCSAALRFAGEVRASCRRRAGSAHRRGAGDGQRAELRSQPARRRVRAH